MTDEALLVYLNKHLIYFRLTLNNLQISPSQVKTISDFVKVNNVKELTLQSCSNAVDIITKDILSSNSKLQKLYIWKSQIGDVEVSAIADWLKLNSSLETLHLRFNQIGDVGASSIADWLKLNSSLQVLSISDNQIGDVGASSIAGSLKFNSTLRELSLEKNQIGDIGASSIGESLKLNSTIRNLYLGNNKIGGVGASSIGDSLNVNYKLQDLSLNENQIGDIGASSIGESLKLNSTIRKLNLGNNQIGDIGASSIGDSLNVNYKLQDLSLWLNQIGDVGASSINKALEANTIITAIYLTGNFKFPSIERNRELVKKFAKHLTEYKFDHKPLWSNLSYLNRCHEHIIEEELMNQGIFPGAVIKQYKDQPQLKTVEEVLKTLVICKKLQKKEDNHDIWIKILPAEIIQKILNEAFRGLRDILAKQLKWESLDLNTNTSKLEVVSHDEEKSTIVELGGDAEDA